MKLAVFLMLRAAPAWLALPRDRRAEIGSKALAHDFGRGDLSFRFFDAEICVPMQEIYSFKFYSSLLKIN